MTTFEVSENSIFRTQKNLAITSHKTEKAFLSYIKVNEEEHAEMLMKHWKAMSSIKN